LDEENTVKVLAMAENRNAIFGRWGPRRPRLARWGGRAVLPVMNRLLSRHGLHRPHSKLERSRLAALAQAIRAGREAYVLGFNTTTHNSGAALVRVSERGMVELICNEEEERYTAEKHCDQFPRHSIDAVKRRMQELGLGPEDLAACVVSWDYASAFNVIFLHPVLEEAPASLAILLKERSAVERVREKSAREKH
jgi:carbamoyltransferase